MERFGEKQALRRGWEDFSTLERKAMRAAILEPSVEKVLAILAARGRHLRKREKDREGDGRRRILVGARVSREEAERVRRCAREKGVSVYRFVVEAIEQMCDNWERGVVEGACLNAGTAEDDETAGETDPPERGSGGCPV